MNPIALIKYLWKCRIWVKPAFNVHLRHRHHEFPIWLYFMLAKRTSLFNPWHRWGKCLLRRVWPIYDMDLHFFMSSIGFYWHGYHPKRIFIDEKKFNVLNFNFKILRSSSWVVVFVQYYSFANSNVSLHSKYDSLAPSHFFLSF